MSTLLIMALMFLLTSATTITYADVLDKQIESAARQSQIYQQHLKNDDIRIKSQDGFVTLTGAVENESEKRMAEEMMENLPGVKGVENKLEIAEPRTPEHSDGWISAKVKAALLLKPNVGGLNTDVSVKDGVVTLKGEAESIQEKDLAAEYAKNVDGVKEVINEMTVKKAGEDEKAPQRTFGEKLDDGMITTKVKAVLMLHRSTSATSTEVETKDGVVTLRGTAKNAAEKDLATQKVQDIEGVKEVVNEMTIEKTK